MTAANWPVRTVTDENESVAGETRTPIFFSKIAKSYNAETETVYVVHIKPVAHNADQYITPLPEYTHLATNSELSVDAEAIQDEKFGFED
jgi:hypothetical protein